MLRRPTHLLLPVAARSPAPRLAPDASGNSHSAIRRQMLPTRSAAHETEWPRRRRPRLAGVTVSRRATRRGYIARSRSAASGGAKASSLMESASVEARKSAKRCRCGPYRCASPRVRIKGWLEPSRPIVGDLTRQVLPEAKRTSGKVADHAGNGGHVRVPDQEEQPSPVRVVVARIARMRADEYAPGDPRGAGRRPDQQRADAVGHDGQRQVGRGGAGDRQRSVDIAMGPVIHAAGHPAQAAGTRPGNTPVIKRQHRGAARREVARETMVDPRGDAGTADHDDGCGRFRPTVRRLEPLPASGTPSSAVNSTGRSSTSGAGFVCLIGPRQIARRGNAPALRPGTVVRPRGQELRNYSGSPGRACGPQASPTCSRGRMIDVRGRAERPRECAARRRSARVRLPACPALPERDQQYGDDDRQDGNQLDKKR